MEFNYEITVILPSRAEAEELLIKITQLVEEAGGEMAGGFVVNEGDENEKE